MLEKVEAHFLQTLHIVESSLNIYNIQVIDFNQFNL